MSLLTSIRKGFSFFLMSMGVSTYGKKNPLGETKPAPPVKPE